LFIIDGQAFRLLHFKTDFPCVGLPGATSGNKGVEILAIALAWLFSSFPHYSKAFKGILTIIIVKF